MKQLPVLPTLPVDALLPEILFSLGSHPNLVLEASPGAGKTTRVPAALLGMLPGEILVLEPRRIAARIAARRVAWEMGEEVGQTVGFQVRFEQVAGPHTRLRFVTEGILTRRLISDPALRGVDAVILDEFHERHLDGDLALALLKRLQRQRPELRIIVMSATLAAERVVRFLGDCPRLRSEGRAYPLTVEHLPYSTDSLALQVRGAVQHLLRNDRGSGILVFLPGAAEIRAAMRACESLARVEDLQMLPLHGELPPAEQDAAIAPSTRRKLILATNVAESSVTIEGISAVIDSGLARFASFSPWTGMPTLQVGRVSRASATQRAGRAGRTGPGQVLRLYPEEDFIQRPAQDTPEILRSDLAQLCLTLRAMGVGDARELTWLDDPPIPAVEHAEVLLDRLGATAAGTAEELARLPLPPRLGRLVLEAVKRGVGETGCAAAALLGVSGRNDANDLLTALDRIEDPRVLQSGAQLRRIVRPAKGSAHEDGALLKAVLSGFPDRVARLRAGAQLLLSSGGSAEMVGAPPTYEFMVVVDAEDRREKPLPVARMTSRIEPEWLIDQFPDRVREESRLMWNREAERVEAVSLLLYDELVLNESRDASPEPAAVEDLLMAKVMEAGLERFVDAEALANLQARMAFAGFPEPKVAAALQELCTGLRSFADVRRAAENLLPLLEGKVEARRLRESAPVNLTLKAGRSVKVHYEVGEPPWIASRLQDFFGMGETPRLGPERTPVVVHLLAPNGRAVQMTSDLPGFWDRLYPQVRRELMRRYPRHQWPEKP